VTRIRSAELAQRTWADAFGWPVGLEDWPQSSRIARKKSFARASRSGTTLVAEDGDTIVGYVQFGARHTPMTLL